MDTTSQRFLSSAIKLGRPPRDCVVFESNPIGITAAHNCSCKVRFPNFVVMYFFSSFSMPFSMSFFCL